MSEKGKKSSPSSSSRPSSPGSSQAKSPGSLRAGGEAISKKQKVKDLFKASRTKPYLLTSFCIHANLTPDSEISESSFDKKLKSFLARKIG